MLNDQRVPCGNFVNIFDCLSVLVIFCHRLELFPGDFPTKIRSSKEPKGLHEAVEEAVPATGHRFMVCPYLCWTGGYFHNVTTRLGWLAKMAVFLKTFLAVLVISAWQLCIFLSCQSWRLPVTTDYHLGWLGNGFLPPWLGRGAGKVRRNWDDKTSGRLSFKSSRDDGLTNWSISLGGKEPKCSTVVLPIELGIKSNLVNAQLLGGDWNHGILWLSIFIGNFIIPTDFHFMIFQRGR